jgi:hypothetical protein
MSNLNQSSKSSLSVAPASFEVENDHVDAGLRRPDAARKLSHFEVTPNDSSLLIAPSLRFNYNMDKQDRDNHHHHHHHQIYGSGYYANNNGNSSSGLGFQVFKPKPTKPPVGYEYEMMAGGHHYHHPRHNYSQHCSPYSADQVNAYYTNPFVLASRFTPPDDVFHHMGVVVRSGEGGHGRSSSSSSSSNSHTSPTVFGRVSGFNPGGEVYNAAEKQNHDFGNFPVSNSLCVRLSVLFVLWARVCV